MGLVQIMAKEKKNWTLFFAVTGGIALTAGFIFSIIVTDKLSEAQKYFAVTLLLMAYILAYVIFIVEGGKK